MTDEITLLVAERADQLRDELVGKRLADGYEARPRGHERDALARWPRPRPGVACLLGELERHFPALDLRR
jgi:hypothetical protein